MYYKTFRNKFTSYRISGAGGEMVRGYDEKAFSKILGRSVVSRKVLESTVKMFQTNYNSYNKEFGTKPEDFFKINYKETRRTNHFGKGNLESFLSNSILLTPLIDSDLVKLKLSTDECSDDNLLMALIYVRYCPKLLDFKFDGGRKINEETIRYARKLNEKYPLKDFNLDFLESRPTRKRNRKFKSKRVFKHKEINEYLKNIFLSNSFRKTFESYYSEEIYENNAVDLDKSNYFSMQFTYPVFAIMKVMNDIQISNNNFVKNDLSWLNKHLESPDYSESTVLSLKEENNILKIENEKLKKSNEHFKSTKAYKIWTKYAKIKERLLNIL